MQHAAVMAALMLPNGGFLLKHHNLGSGPPLKQAVRSRQTDDAASDNDDPLCHSNMIKASAHRNDRASHDR
jgi:hypothetical protein